MTEHLEHDAALADQPVSGDGHSVIDESVKSGSSKASQSRNSNQNILLAAKGGGITFSGTVFNHGTRLVIGVLLARLLGAELYGLYVLAIPAAMIAAGVATLGLGQAMVRYVAIFNGRRDVAGVWGTLQIGLGITAITGLLVGISLYLLAEPIADRIFEEPRLIPLLRLLSLLVPLLVLTKVASAVIRGFNKMQYPVIADNIFKPLSRLLLIVVFAIGGLTVAEVVAIRILTLGMVLVILLYFLNRLFRLRRSLRTGQRNFKEIFTFSLPIWFSGLIQTAGGQMQILLLGAFSTVTNVGIFAVAVQVSRLGDFFHNSIIVSSRPIFAQLYDQDQKKQMAHFYQTMTKWTFTINLPLFLMMVLFPEAILSIFGRDFVVGGVAALSILAWRNLANAGTGICGVVLDMTGRTDLKLINTIVRVGLLVGLNILLIPRLGIVGAAIAALVTVVIANLLPFLEVFILFRLVPYNLSFVKPILAALMTVFAVLTISQWLPPEASLIYLVVNGLFLFAIYIGVILVLGLSQEDRLVLARLRKRMGKALSSS